jgi:hypothetical protein
VMNRNASLTRIVAIMLFGFVIIYTLYKLKWRSPSTLYT